MRLGWFLAFCLPGWAIAATSAGVVLSRPETLVEAQRKAERAAWARQSLQELIARARQALQQPVELPTRGGQWPHWYSCSRDGARLKTLSATEHQCPVCQRVYTGEPYDSVVLYYEHNRYSREARDCALAYHFTGEPQFLERTRQILLAYAQRYTSYPRHDRFGKDTVGGGRAMAQTLDESVWLIPLAWAYSLVRDQLDAGQRKRIEEGLLLPAAEVIREHRLGIHNIQCWKNSAVGLVGFVTGKQELVREAIDDPDRGFRVQIERGVTEDGLWWEGSLGYHQYTLAALWPLAEIARAHGIDLYTERYRRMFDAPLALALPNGDPPGFNDSPGSNVTQYAPLYELAYARWRDPVHGRVLRQSKRVSLESLLWGIEELPEGPTIPTHSQLLRHAGYAMLRSPSMVVAVRFGMHGGGHGHPDKLNIVTFGAGKLAGLDPGSIHYGVPLHQEWYRATIAHNTVAVDEANQASVDGQLQSWKADGAMTELVAMTREAYPGVTLRRHLRLDAEKLEDSFECESTQMHTYDWAFHVAGTPILDGAWEPSSGTLGQANGYQHIRLTHRRIVDQDWVMQWDLGDGVAVQLNFRAGPQTEAFVGRAPGRDPNEPLSVLVVRRRTNATRFVVTHRFVTRAGR